MRIISRRILREFWEKPGRKDAEQPLRAWANEIEKAIWKKPSDIKAHYRNASFLGKDRVIFNIGGNKYRLIVAVHYKSQIVFIRFIGTHTEYDEIDVERI